MTRMRSGPAPLATSGSVFGPALPIPVLGDSPGRTPRSAIRKRPAEERDQVAVAEREHRIQVHRRAALRQAQAIAWVAASARNSDRASTSPPGGWSARPCRSAPPRCRSPDVAALACSDPGFLSKSPSQIRIPVLEQGGTCKPPHDLRLGHAGRPGHRVDVTPPKIQHEDPAGTGSSAAAAAAWPSDRPSATPAPRPAATSARVIPPIRNSATSAASARSTHSRARRGGDHPDLLVRTGCCPHTQSLASGLDQRLRPAGSSASNTSTPAVAHHLGEHVVLGLGSGHPQHVVEQQLLGVRRGQPAALQTGPVDHDPTEPAYF